MPVTDPRWTAEEDDALVAAVRAGQPAAFAPLVDRHLAAVHAFVALRLPVAHLVDEITHEAFVFTFHHLADYRPGTSLRAWLRAIAGNLVRAETERHYREQRNRQRYSEQCLVEQEASRPDAQAAAEADRLAACLEALPDGMRSLLKLKYHDGCSSAEIAGRVQRSLVWVRTTLFRLRQQLRACLDARLTVPPEAA